jgi:hypothetical protein
MRIKQVIGEYFNIYDKHYKDGKVYGKSSEDLLELLAPHIIKLNPKSILDYGCGRSGLIHYFWNDGKRTLDKYDPAIREYRNMPDGEFDLVICTDVMEHIPKDSLRVVLKKIKLKSNNVIFGISTIPARQKFSDGTNAHITLMPKDEWIKYLKGVGFRIGETITEDNNGFIIRTW